MLKRLEDNNKGMLNKILESDNEEINKHVVNLINDTNISIGKHSTDAFDKNIKKGVNQVDELNNKLDKLLKEKVKLIEDNEKLNNEVTYLNSQLNSLTNQSEVIELLKSQIEDKINLTRLLDQQQRLAIDSNSRIKYLEKDC